MARVSLVLGESSSGKSRSIKNLPPKHTFIVNVVGKDLPFRGSEANYPLFDKNTGEGNMLTTKSTSTIIKTLQYINEHRPEIKIVVVDDNQYISLFTYRKYIDEKDWQKYNIIAANMLDLVEACKALRSDIQVYFLQHIESGETVMGDQQVQAKTMGKFIKEKVTYEGLFTVVLLCDKEEAEDGTINHFFWTRKAKSTVKTPEEMFADQKIPNDLRIVAKAIHDYYL
jgi:hypothetical protein